MKATTLKKYLLIIAVLFSSLSVFSQLPNPAMVGYWENWNGSRFIDLKDIDPRYNVIQVSFAEQKPGKNYELEFTPAGSYSEQDFKDEIIALQNQGKKVLISVGGQNAVVLIKTETEKDAFVASLNQIVDYWGFDGVDIDLEGNSLGFTDVNVQNPGDVKLQYLITGIQEVMEHHYLTHGEKLLLTMAPETFYVQGGLSSPSLGEERGAYLPMIEALKDSIDMLNVQLYNSGSMYGLDGNVYAQGTGDWILAMTEVTIQGFQGTGTLGTFNGFPSPKIGVALPGCHSYDAVPHKEMEAAIRYLKGEIPQTGNYTLVQNGGYPDLMGMMTWSINSDRSCSPSYGFVDTYSKIFTDSTYIEIENNGDIYEGEEDSNFIAIKLFNDYFKTNLDTSKWEIDNLPEGTTIDSLVRVNDSLVHVQLGGNSTSSYSTCIWNVSATIDSSEVLSTYEDLYRSTGVILKKQPSQIPGVVEGESAFQLNSGYFTNNWDTNGGKLLRLNEGTSGDIEIDVEADGIYSCDFKFATSSGTYKVIFKIDGYINSVQYVSSSSTYTEFDIAQFDLTLTEGKHIMTVYVSQGWMNIDFMELKNVTGVNAIQKGQISFYPNPANNTIYFNESISGSVSFYNLNGKLVDRIQSTSLPL